MPAKKITLSKNLFRSPLKIISILLLVALLIAAMELTNTTHFFHITKAKSGKIPVITTPPPKSLGFSSSTTTSNGSNASASNPPPTFKSSGGSASSTGTSSSSTPLIVPFGSFVSNHSPNLSDSPAPSKEQSVCNTSAGASCVLRFTNDAGIVKTLPSQTADSSGSVTWVWDVNTAGFTPGNWRITATATLNGESKSASDQLLLKVQP